MLIEATTVTTSKSARQLLSFAFDVNNNRNNKIKAVAQSEKNLKQTHIL